LPDSLSAGVGVFPIQGKGQKYAPVPVGEMVFMDQLNPAQVDLERLDQAFWEHRDPVLLALSIPDEDQAILEIEVFNAQANAFRDPEPTAIEDFRHQLVEASHKSDHLLDLLTGEDRWEAFGFLSPNGSKREIQVNMEHFPVEEEDRTEGLVLSSRGDMSLNGQER